MTLLFVAGALLFGSTSSAHPDTHPVNVHVVQSDGVTGLAGVSVNYSCEGGPILSFGTTDSNGHAGPVSLEVGDNCDLYASYRGTSATGSLTVDSNNNVYFQTSGVTVTLSDHSGGPLVGGSVGYRSGSTTYWLNPAGSSTSTTDSGGSVTGQLFGGIYDFRMQYNHGTEWQNGVTVTAATTPTSLPTSAAPTTPVDFQTGLLSVVYSESLSYGQGNPNSGWFTKSGMELLPGTYDFHPRGVGYPAGSGCSSVPITSPAAGGTATKTILAAQVADSNGDPLSGGQAYYKTGSTHFLGSATDGSGSACQVVDGALGNVEVWMSYRGTTSAHKTQDVTTNSIFAFQTSAVTVTLHDHTGLNGLSGGTVAYRPWDTTGTGTWLNPGGSSASTTDSNGEVVGQLFDGTYDFRMQYNGGTEWQEDVPVSGATPVDFQTGLLSVVYSESLSYGQGNPNSGWFTKSGMELLPGTYDFHPRGVGYPAGSGCSSVPITSPAAGETATKTILAAQLRDSTGNPLTGGTFDYYVYPSGWHYSVGTTDSSGAACVVVDGALGANISVAMHYNGSRQQIAPQNVVTNSVFSFQTGEVHSLSNTATRYYVYPAGWLTFSQDMQLLPGTYTFEFSDYPNTPYTILAGQENPIH